MGFPTDKGLNRRPFVARGALVGVKNRPRNAKKGGTMTAILLKSLRMGALALSAVALAKFAAGVSYAADPVMVAKIATYDKPDRQAVLEAGARKEGQLLVYTVGAQIDPVVAAFNAKYPFLSVKVLKSDPPDLVKRVTQEYKAGVYNVDVFELDDFGLQPLLQGKLLAPFWSPEMTNYGPEAIEATKRWAMMRQDFVSLGFNTDAVSPDDAPRTHQDLLDPKWKGKMGLAARPSSIVTWVGALVLSEGEDFVRKLGQQDFRLYNLGGRAVSNLVVSGEAPIVANNRSSHMHASRKEGAKVSWRALGPSYTSVSGTALPIRANNPHAAMLFVDFLLSKEAQKIYSDDLGYSSMRTDMPSADAPMQKLYLTLRPNFFREYEQWNALTDSVFRIKK